MKKVIQKHIGELLVDCQLITKKQLEEVLILQAEQGGLLGELLISMGYVTEENIAHALTAQYGFPYLQLASYEIDREVAKIIPEEIAKKYGLIAVDRVGSILTVAMTNPLNAEAIVEVELITHYKVQVFVTTSTDVAIAIRGVYKKA